MIKHDKTRRGHLAYVNLHHFPERVSKSLNNVPTFFFFEFWSFQQQFVLEGELGANKGTPNMSFTLVKAVFQRPLPPTHN